METEKKSQWLVVVGAVAVLGLLIFFGTQSRPHTPGPEVPPPPVVPTQNDFPTVEPEEGSIILGLNETGVFRNFSITPKAILEDSRCPIEAVCIWMGRVLVSVEIVSARGTSTETIELGTSINTPGENIKFAIALPAKSTQTEIGGSDYRFTFQVSKRTGATVLPTPIAKTCYIGGCSSQVCSDRPDAVTTCEYRSEYACYQGAECKVQANGECGWTQTAELRACLNNPAPLY